MTAKKNEITIIPTFRVASPEVRLVLQAEANSRQPLSVSLARICQEALAEYIFAHGLFTKHGITPPNQARNG